jgi:glycosyltransferase involved in cell wall biosynthesis
MTGKPLVLIDFEVDGHHASYVCHLVRYGVFHRERDFSFLIRRELLEGVRSLLNEEQFAFFAERARLMEDDPAWVRINRWAKKRVLAQWLYVEYLNLHESRESRLLCLFMESVIYPLALSPMPRFRTSGIMFRATFYYREQKMLAPGAANRALFALKWMVGYLLAKRPGFERIFLLDPLAERYAREHWGAKKFVLLPDPLGLASREQRPVGGGEAMIERPLRLVIAGALHPRKGIHLTVDALAKSKETTLRSIRMVFVGRPEEGATAYAMENIARLEAMGVEVESELRFISDAELDAKIAGASVVLTPYVGFKGSSGILIHAAHWGRPVISTSDGLLGYLVPHHGLGAAIDVGDAAAFAGLLDRLAETGKIEGYDPVRARAFADSCDPEEFARMLTEE